MSQCQDLSCTSNATVGAPQGARARSRGRISAVNVSSGPRYAKFEVKTVPKVGQAWLRMFVLSASGGGVTVTRARQSHLFVSVCSHSDKHLLTA